MSKRIYVTFTDKQAEKIESLIGPLGNSAPDVVSTIVTMWLFYQKQQSKTEGFVENDRKNNRS